MRRSRLYPFLRSLVLLSGFNLLSPLIAIAREPGETVAARPARVNPATRGLDKLPLRFEANRGQVRAEAKFLARGPGYHVLLASTHVELLLKTFGAEAPAELRMTFVGANPAPKVTGIDEFRGRINYFIGNDQARWIHGIPAYRRVAYRDIYPGIDAVYYGNPRQLEYDLVVAPGADPRTIELAFDGAETLGIDGTGDVVLRVSNNELRLRKPEVYQVIDGVRRAVQSRYALRRRADGGTRVGIQVIAHDASKPLIIDPTLVYTTYLGGEDEDEARGIAVDAEGNIYVAGMTRSPDFPRRSPYRDIFRGANEAFVTKLYADGSDFVYSTFLGGNREEEANAIAVDGAGNAYVTGKTNSPDFPTTGDALQRGPQGLTDAFVAVFADDGQRLIYSTRVGGRDAITRGLGVAVDTDGNIYVTGDTDSQELPTRDPRSLTTDPFQPEYGGGSSDAFVAKFYPNGEPARFDPYYVTYLGGGGADDGNAITVDNAGNAYVTGSTNSGDPDPFPVTEGAWRDHLAGLKDAFVTKLNADGTALIYSTYVGGELDDFGNAIAVDGEGNVYIAGSTNSFSFPVTPGVFRPAHSDCPIRPCSNAFATKLRADGQPSYSTYINGPPPVGETRIIDAASAIAVDRDGNAYVAGTTSNSNFPVLRSLFPWVGGQDAFVTKLNREGTGLGYSTFINGSEPGATMGSGITVRNGRAYVTGTTTTLGLRTTEDAVQPYPGDPKCKGNGCKDAFVVVIDDAP